MSHTNGTAGQRHRRFFLGVDIAVGAALVAATIALAHEARADADLDPFEDLFGTAGINSWTPSADGYLASIDPTNALAANLDTSVDNFVTVAGPPYFYGPDLVFSSLAYGSDPNAFDIPIPMVEFLIPTDATGDVALGLDYMLFASGLAPVVDPLITDLVQVSQLPQELLDLSAILAIFLFGPLFG
jgi:hypothetical protein